jgi:citrate lyase subunit beta/citryl-CoA lyase
MNKETLRRSLLYVSGSKPGSISQAPFYGPDCIIYDLEDSVPITEKDAARFLIFNTLGKKRPDNIEIIVRVNAMDTPFGREDLEAIVRAKPDIIRFPKIETPEDVRIADEYISIVEEEAGLEVGSTKIIAGMETHTGVLNARQIALASKRIVAISIGGEDFTASMKTTRSVEGLEMFYARNAILLAARAAGVQAIDTVFSDINNTEGLIEDTKLIKRLGFDGKYLIHPRQVEPVNNVFTPNEKEIQNAIRILYALEEANKKNLGVVALDGKMIDAPVVERAKRVIAMAKASGVIAGGEINVNK